MKRMRTLCIAASLAIGLTGCSAMTAQNPASALSPVNAAPTKHLPQYGGHCANGIMLGIPWGGNPSDFKWGNNKLYIFGGTVSQAAFELELDKNIALADSYWQQEIQGSNSFIQRTKRLVMRVPHYKTGEEQAAEVQAASKLQI